MDREGGGGGGVRFNCNLKFWMVKRENMNENGPAGMEVERIFGPVWSWNIWSNCGVQLPWTASIPHVKGDHPVWSNHRCIRHGAVLCRIVNWKGLTAYNVTSPLNIWSKYAFSDTLWSNLKRGKLCCFYYLFYWVDCEMGGEVELLSEILNGETREHEWNVPAGIEVGRIFGPVWNCLGPLVVHMWKGTTTFSLILAL